MPLFISEQSLVFNFYGLTLGVVTYYSWNNHRCWIFWNYIVLTTESTVAGSSRTFQIPFYSCSLGGDDCHNVRLSAVGVGAPPFLGFCFFCAAEAQVSVPARLKAGGGDSCLAAKKAGVLLCSGGSDGSIVLHTVQNGLSCLFWPGETRVSRSGGGPFG